MKLPFARGYGCQLEGTSKSSDAVSRSTSAARSPKSTSASAKPTHSWRALTSGKSTGHMGFRSQILFLTLFTSMSVTPRYLATRARRPARSNGISTQLTHVTFAGAPTK